MTAASWVLLCLLLLSLAAMAVLLAHAMWSRARLQDRSGRLGRAVAIIAFQQRVISGAGLDSPEISLLLGKLIRGIVDGDEVAESAAQELLDSIADLVGTIDREATQ